MNGSGDNHAPKKQVFFGFKVTTKWPDQFPQGRLVPEHSRHVTFAFLGKVPWDALQKQLEKIPLPPAPEASSKFSRTLFLPPLRPRVVAWELYLDARLQSYQQRLCSALRNLGYDLEERPFLPHMTIARAPFPKEEWEKFPLPVGEVRLDGLHLFESRGNLQYQSIWKGALKSTTLP